MTTKARLPQTTAGRLAQSMAGNAGNWPAPIGTTMNMPKKKTQRVTVMGWYLRIRGLTSTK
jgi:hypothetical protein